MITHALAEDRRHRAIALPWQSDVILFIPLDLPRSVDTSAIIPLIDRLQFRRGRLAAELATLADSTAMLRLLNRWEAVIISASDNREADFRTLLLDEHNPGRRDQGPHKTQAADYAALSDAILAEPGDPMTPDEVAHRIRQMHGRLTTTSAIRETSGSYRSHATGAGGFVVDQGRIAPPPPVCIDACMTDLARFIAQPSALPFLLRVAMVWAQLLAIAPFDFGNAMLCHALANLMSAREGYAPLFNAGFLAKGRTKAQTALRAAILDGNWTPWFAYFLQTVDLAIDTVLERVTEVQAILSRWESRLGSTRQHSFAHGAAAIVACRPAITPLTIKTQFGVSNPTARAALQRLVDLGILRPQAKSQKSHIYLAPEIMALFTADPADKPITLTPQPKPAHHRALSA
jgi:Fic family protein